ncbi:hypothetical protein [Rhizobium phage RHph_X2_26]|nr:hypothetical protein [Rhizobium phage RHph_X2_26]
MNAPLMVRGSNVIVRPGELEEYRLCFFTGRGDGFMSRRRAKKAWRRDVEWKNVEDDPCEGPRAVTPLCFPPNAAGRMAFYDGREWYRAKTLRQLGKTTLNDVINRRAAGEYISTVARRDALRYARCARG